MSQSSIIDIFQSVVDSAKAEDELLYEPLPPRQFFTSEYHCGFPRSMITDFWLEEMCDFIEGGYNELIITGSIGSIKTTSSNLILLYKTYELFAHKSINAFFKLPRVQDIYNFYFNVNVTQAKLTGFSQLKNMFDESQWFQKEFPRNKNLNSIIDFPDKPTFKLSSGSGHQHSIGMTVWTFILDEGDFFKKGAVGFDEGYSHVTNMYNELIDRRVSRFQKGDYDPSFSILISSASFQSSFVEKRISQAATDPKIKVVKAVKYKIFPQNHSKEKFVVFTGDTNCDPEIVDSTAQINLINNKLGISQRVDESKTPIEIHDSIPPQIKEKYELVPNDLRKRFDNNLAKSLQNFCGVFIAAEGKLFQSKQLLFSNYRTEQRHPFSKAQIELSTGDSIQLQSYFSVSALNYIDRPHALHLDGSYSGDSTGLSMVRYDGMNGNRRVYSQVFSIEILPPPAPYHIKLSKIRDFILFLYKDVKVNIVKFTQDQFNSEDNLQLLADAGVTVARQSIDKSDAPYLAWMSLLLDNAVTHYKYQVLEKEAFAAIHDRRKHKVFHPTGSDAPNINVLQSFVGALYNLVTLDSGDIQTNDNYELPTMANNKVNGAKELNKLTGTHILTSDFVGGLKNMKRSNTVYSNILNF